MPVWPAAITAVVLSCLLTATAWAEPCRDPAQGLGVARIAEIDASNGPVFGALTSQLSEKRFLAPKEVVLTFDDGPMPGVTRSVLDTLDRFCTKATFFAIGRMALAYPDLVREVLDRGHTLGTHTWSHPLNLPRLGLERARDQIDSGFAAVVLAAGRPIAPFFRFPGLSDSGPLLAHLQQRAVATFTVDVVSNDSYLSDPSQLLARTLERADAHNGGILLFHDIKQVTARALPSILAALKARGYSVVHLRAKTPYAGDERYLTAVKDYVESHPASFSAARRQLLAVTADLAASEQPAPTPGAATSPNDPPVTTIAAPARDRLAKSSPGVADGKSAPPYTASDPASSSAGLALVEPAENPAGGGQAPAGAQRATRASEAAGAATAPRWISTYNKRLSDSGG
jgi:peptidoglycan/xylan/chitin deacetylase (PgdA/CDA1 family)